MHVAYDSYVGQGCMAEQQKNLSATCHMLDEKKIGEKTAKKHVQQNMLKKTLRRSLINNSTFRPRQQKYGSRQRGQMTKQYTEPWTQKTKKEQQQVTRQK